MKKYTLQLLRALFTVNNYYRVYAVKVAVLAALLCGMSIMGYGQVTINITTPTSIASGNVCPATTNVNIYAFTLTGTTAGAANTVTAIGIPIFGGTTAVMPGDIIEYQLWRTAGGGAGTLLGTITSGNVFSGLSEVYNNGTTNNYWITMNVAATPTTGHFLTVSNISTPYITASGGPASVTSGATGGGNTQTITAQPAVTGITATPTPLCVGNTLTLTAIGSSGAIASYNWTGPAGYSAASATNTKTYIVPATSASGVYSLTLSPNGTGCVNNTVYTAAAVTVNAAPSLPATSYICTGAPTTLNSGNATGTWTSSNSSVATVDPATGKVYSTTVGGTTTITNNTACGTASTLATVATRPVGIYGPNSSPGFPGGDQFVCTGSSITLSDATTGGVWSSTNVVIASVVAAGPANVGTVTGGNIAPGAAATTILYTNAITGCDTTITIEVNPTPYPIYGADTVCQGSTVQLGDITDATTLSTWSSSAIGTATVTIGPGVGGGVVTGIAAGVANITYQVINTGCYVTYSVTVLPLPQPIVGASLMCTALTTTFSDPTASTPPGGTWSSGAPNVATIDSITGVATGVTAGATNIIFTRLVTGCSVSVLLNVNQQPGPISGVDSVCAGLTVVLSDSPPGGTWSSSQSAIATVGSLTGIVTGQYAGPVALVATINYNMPTCLIVSYSVTVNPAPGPITGVPDVCVGFTTALSDTTGGGIWTNSNYAVDTFTTIPTILGREPGFSIITYTLPTHCFVQDTFIVNPNPDSIKGPDSVCQGATVTRIDATAGGTWSSTSLAIAQIVDSSGVLTGISAGGARISYTLNTGCYAVDTITVKPPVIASVSISSNATGLICAGTLVTFIANPVNGGIPTYQWYKFVTPQTTPLAFDSAYLDSPTIVGDIIIVDMTTHGSCAVDTTVIDTLYANVYPIAGVQVSITTSPSNDSASFLGEVYTFFANVTYGGASPAYQWYMNNEPIAGATNSSYATPVYQDDNFYCVVTGTPPCDIADTVGASNNINIYATYLLGVDPLAVTTSDLVLFPNPTSGNIVLSGNVNMNSGSDLDVEVSDMLGHLVYKGKTTPQNGAVRAEINLENLATGTYLMHVYSGSLSQVFHFVVNK